MILIVTHREDYTADFIVNQLNRKGFPYHRLNTEDIGTVHNISISFDPKIGVSIDGYNFFSSIWYRRTKTPTINTANQSEIAFFHKDFNSFLLNLWSVIKTKKWLSEPSKINASENKVYQLSVAQSLGFNIPETKISTDSSIIKSFYNAKNKDLIVKPLRGGRYYEGNNQKLIFTNKLKEEHIAKDSDFVMFPMIFQEEIKKTYEVRVTVVDEIVFSARINSQSSEFGKIDWRKDRLKFQKYDLPREIEKKCLELLKVLGLKFGAIDLIKTEEGYTFLEINPNGQWVWIEKETGLKISDAIITYLTT